MATATLPIQSQSQSQLESIPKETRDEIRNTILDPVLFAKRWLGIEVLWDTQIKIMRSVMTRTKTSAKACHASSKTFTAAILTLWWLARYQNAIVVTTAPTMNQVQNLLWAEINRLVKQSKYPWPEPTMTSLRIAPKRYALGFTTSITNGDMGTKFQGFHADHVLVVLDEAPGVSGMIWGAIEGLLASGDVRVLALGNPTISSGPFFDSFGVNRVAWNNFTISAFDMPNFKDVYLKYRTVDSETGQEKIKVLGNINGRNLLDLTEDELRDNEYPFLTSKLWVRDRFLEWGAEHPSFRSRVLGEFASQSPDSLISLDWLEKAKYRTLFDASKYKFSAGIDVAGPGEDETVLVIRQGPNFIELRAWPNPDPRGELVNALRPYKDKLDTVNVDSCGIGYYLARHLEDLGFPVSDVNVGEGARDKEKYVNLKAELYWGLRMRLETGDLAGFEDEMAQGQLAGIRFKMNSRGQIVIESKEEAVKRGVKSPDRAEAVMLAFAPSQHHGFFTLLEEEAEKIEQPNALPQISSPNQTTDPIELAEAQKKNTGWVDMVEELQAKNGPRGLVKIVTTDQQPDQCPKCGNKGLAIYAGNAWRCNMCGTAGKGPAVYDEFRNLVPIA